jgi:hypothetical protein
MAQVARMAEQWGNDDFPAPEHREETVRAAGLHDNGWREWEDHPTLMPDSGRPRNLTEVEPAVHAAFYRAGVERAAAIDPYTGLLVSMHASALYAGVDGWDLDTLTPPDRPDLASVQRTFIADQSRLQRALREDLASSPRYGRSVEPDRLWPAYLRLRAWDRLSLYFVYHGMGEWLLDHVPSIHGETPIALQQMGEYDAVADPWPFSHDRAIFPVVVSRVPDRVYETGGDFLHELVHAPPEVWEFTLRKP